MYNASQAAGGADAGASADTGSGDEEVTDVDFEEVSEDK